MQTERTGQRYPIINIICIIYSSRFPFLSASPRHIYFPNRDKHPGAVATPSRILHGLRHAPAHGTGNGNGNGRTPISVSCPLRPHLRRALPATDNARASVSCSISDTTRSMDSAEQRLRRAMNMSPRPHTDSLTLARTPPSHLVFRPSIPLSSLRLPSFVLITLRCFTLSFPIHP